MSKVNQATNVNNAKPKKKRKFIFLKVLLGIFLGIVLVIAGIIGSVKLGKYLGAKKMDKLPVYPIVFEDDNSPLYVVDDFKVMNSYEIDGKTVNTTWKSSSSLVEIDEEGNVTVTRPENQSGVVTLTESYKKFLVKGSRTFEVVLISKNNIKEEDVNVIDIESVRNDTYPFPMQILLKDDGTIDYAYGEFENLYAYTKEDAIAIANAYKELLGIPEEVSFYIDKVVGNDIRAYNLQMYTGEIALIDQIVTITVDKDFRVIKINNDYSFTDEEFEQIKNLDESMYENTLLEYMDSKTSEKYYFSFDGVGKRDDTACLMYFVLLDVFDNHYVYVDINENIVIDDSTLKSSIKEKDYTTVSGLSGKDEYGNNLKFTASQSNHKDLAGMQNYVLYDKERNIRVYEKDDWLIEDILEGTSMIERNSKGIKVRFSLESLKNVNILLWPAAIWYGKQIKFKGRLVYSGSDVFSGDYFNYPVANETYTNFQKVYDFYLKNLKYKSYDGNGSPIDIVTDMDGKDGAAFYPGPLIFGIEKKYKFNTTYAAKLDVMGHEYMHAVFYANSRHFDAGNEYCSISEGYADVFGIIMGQKEGYKNDWVIGVMQCNDGSKEVVRDVKNYNNPLDGEENYPTKYYGENFEVQRYNKKGEKEDFNPHINSVLISHIAYEMSESEYFTTDDVLKVYVDSSLLGFDSDATFVDARKNILQAIENAGYSAEAYNYVADKFDEEEIFDPDFVRKGVEEKEEPTNPNFIYTEGNAIDGDIIWDNNEKREFIVAYSILGSVFGDAKIYIISESTGATQEEIDEVSQTLTDKFNDNLLTESDFLNKTIEVEYQEYNKFTFPIVKKCLEGSQKTMRDKASSIFDDNASDEAKDILDIIMSLIFRVDIYEETPYHFFYSLLQAE